VTSETGKPGKCSGRGGLSTGPIEAYAQWIDALKAANLVVKFLLELCAFIALAYWGAATEPFALGLILGIAAPAAAIGLWSVFAAPTSAHRLPGGARVAFELTVFALSVLGLAAAGQGSLALILAGVMAVNAAGLIAWKQDAAAPS
jgi:hypothetical protein